MEIADNHPKFVLSMDRDWEEGREGIHRIYLPDFLLKDVTPLRIDSGTGRD